MTKQQIKDLVAAKIAGQGNQVDAGGALSSILDAIVDAIPEGGGGLQTLEIAKFPTNGALYADGLDEMGISEQQAKDLFSGKYQFIKDKANEYILVVGAVSYTAAETGEGWIVAGIVGENLGVRVEMQGFKDGGWEVTEH